MSNEPIGDKVPPQKLQMGHGSSTALPHVPEFEFTKENILPFEPSEVSKLQDRSILFESVGDLCLAALAFGLGWYLCKTLSECDK
jgi:hypothetical protein